MSSVSVCGIDCSVACIECNKYLDTPCKGCNEEKGRLYWTKYLGLEVCPIYNCCVNIKGFEDCGRCENLPCEIFFSTKDPSISEELFQEKIKERVDLLKKQ